MSSGDFLDYTVPILVHPELTELPLSTGILGLGQIDHFVPAKGFTVQTRSPATRES